MSNFTPIATFAPANASVFNAPLNELDLAIGSLPGLTTMDKASLVAAINSLKATVDSEIGSLPGLTTSDKANLVAAINGLKATVDFIESTTSGIVSSTVNQPGNLAAGATEIIVDSVAGFVAGAYIVYANSSGTTEYRQISSINSGASKLLLSSATSIIIPDNSLLAMITVEEYLSKGNYPTVSARLNGIDSLPGAARLSAAVSAGATTINLRQAGGLAPSMYVIIAPYSTTCEIRRLTAVAGTSATVAALSFAHSADTEVLWQHAPVFSASLFSPNLHGEASADVNIQLGVTQIAALGGGELHLPAGAISATGKVDVAEKTRIVFSRGTTYTLRSDAIAFQLKDGGWIEGNQGRLNVALSSGTFTKAAIYLDGADTIHFQEGKQTGMCGLYISLPAGQGKGLHMYAEGDTQFEYITGCRFYDFTISNGAYGIFLDGGIFEPNDYFINTNFFADFTLINQSYPIWWDMDVLANGNLFNSFMIQVGVDTIQPMRIGGRENQFLNFYLWDFVSGPVELELGEDSSRNILIGAIFPVRVRDYGADNQIVPLFRQMHHGKISTYGLTSNGIHTYGPHSDVLANANYDFTVTQTTGSAVSAGALADMFTNKPIGFAKWTAPTLPISLEVDMGATLRMLDGIGITFEQNYTPGHIKIEVYDTAWTTIFDHEVNVIDSFYLPAPTYTGGDTTRLRYIQKIRVTFSALGDGVSDLTIYNLYAHFTPSYGNLWTPRKDATFVTAPKLPVYAFANLPFPSQAGKLAYCSNGRKNGEGVGAGTGVLVFHDGTAWKACDTGATAAA